VVLLIGFESIDTEWEKTLFYVASTRARSVLEVFLPENANDCIEKAIPKVLHLINQ